ncbi:DUF6093 family protein [Rothia nasimurium]|uniref:DUF6093 family protein n=1 Tax=Rothia nasimurium TaxID=85336 RepID=UPI001F307B10|nr:DUF6093 family protein [Rothia nasimurium]
MSPIPGSRVVPAGWSERHRPVAVGSMTGRADVVVTVPRTSILDEGGDALVAEGVPCRVQQLNRAANGATVGQEAHLRDYLVTVPVDTPVGFRAGADGHRLRITQADATAAVGLELTIKQVLKGTLLWELDLICEHNQTQQGA